MNTNNKTFLLVKAIKPVFSSGHVYDQNITKSDVSKFKINIFECLPSIHFKISKSFFCTRFEHIHVKAKILLFCASKLETPKPILP